MRQTDGQSVQVHGLTKLSFTGGMGSTGRTWEALKNQATIEDHGVDITEQIAVNS